MGYHIQQELKKHRFILKYTLTLFLLNLFCITFADAGINEPGKKNSIACALNALDGYKEALEYQKKNPKKNTVVYLSCSDPQMNWNWSWSGRNKISTAHKRAFKNCSKNSKKNNNGECFLFSENDKINFHS